MRFLVTNFRFLIIAVLLFSAALLLQARSRSEVIPSRQPLSEFPKVLHSWSGTDVPIDRDTREVLGPGDFLLREYGSNGVPPVDLFVAYFPSQRSGDTIHSPKHCLPGAGWVPVESSHVMMSAPGRAPFPANRYLIARGDERELVYYWFQAHDRVVASEYWAKFYLITDAMRMNRSDGALVRLATPIEAQDRLDAAEARINSLAAQVVPLLNTYVPR